MNCCPKIRIVFVDRRKSEVFEQMKDSKTEVLRTSAIIKSQKRRVSIFYLNFVLIFF